MNNNKHDALNVAANIDGILSELNSKPPASQINILRSLQSSRDDLTSLLGSAITHDERALLVEQKNALMDFIQEAILRASNDCRKLKALLDQNTERMTPKQVQAYATKIHRIFFGEGVDHFLVLKELAPETHAYLAPVFMQANARLEAIQGETPLDLSVLRNKSDAAVAEVKDNESYLGHAA